MVSIDVSPGDFLLFVVELARQDEGMIENGFTGLDLSRRYAHELLAGAVVQGGNSWEHLPRSPFSEFGLGVPLNTAMLCSSMAMDVLWHLSRAGILRPGRPVHTYSDEDDEQDHYSFTEYGKRSLKRIAVGVGELGELIP